MSISGDDCDRPIKLWLIITASVLGAHALFLILVESYKTDRLNNQIIGGVYMGVNTIVHAFTFVWMLVGLVWAFDDPDEC